MSNTIKGIKNRNLVLLNMFEEIKRNTDTNCSCCRSRLEFCRKVEILLHNLLISEFKGLSAENKQLIINRNSFILQSFKEYNRWNPTPTSPTCCNCAGREILINVFERLLLSDIIALNFQKNKKIV